MGSRRVGLEILGVLKDYEEYRRSLYGEITHKALLVDAVGTLVVPSQPMAQVCKTISVNFYLFVWLFVIYIYVEFLGCLVELQFSLFEFF